jgi:hypothetical protein
MVIILIFSNFRSLLFRFSGMHNIDKFFHISITFLQNNHQYNFLVADNKRNMKVIISMSVIVGAIAIFIFVFFSWKWMATHRGNMLRLISLLDF